MYLLTRRSEGLGLDALWAVGRTRTGASCTRNVPVFF